MGLKIREYRESDQDAVVALWEKCELVVPRNDPRKDIERNLAVQREMFLVGTLGLELVATAVAGYEGHRGWINNLAVDPRHRRLGYGRALMTEAESRLKGLGCPKVNLQVRTSNLGAVAFYERIGYSIDEVVSLGKRIAED